MGFKRVKEKKMKIHYITPYSTEGNIGKAYNEAISDLPDDCYICLRDGDTMFLTPDWGNQIEAIIRDNPHYDVITCRTNRLGLTDLVIFDMDHSDISRHIYCANALWDINNTAVKPTSTAPGMLMIFHKSTWQKHNFVEKSIIFDKQFSNAVTKGGGKIGIALGLYIFHIYRMWSKAPKSDTRHLLKNAWKLKS